MMACSEADFTISKSQCSAAIGEMALDCGELRGTQ